MAEEVFDFVVMEKADLFADDVGELDEGMIEGFDVALGEVFEEAAEGDEMIGLGDGFEVFAVLVGFAVEGEAEFAKELGGDVDGEEVGKVGFFVFIYAQLGVFLEDAEGDIAEAKEIATIIFGGFLRTAVFDLEAFDEIDDEFGERGLRSSHK